VGDDHVELVAMDDEIGLALRRGVDRAVDELDLAEIGAQILAQELVVIAGQDDDARARQRLLEQALDELVYSAGQYQALARRQPSTMSPTR
jgi:hypothetical protein